MQVDSFLKIGKKHEVCEDYITTGKINNTDEHYIVLSDGCSSSKHTDVGARLLVHTVARLLSNKSIHFSEYDEIIKSANYIAVALLGLPSTCLDATLITACTQNEFIHINVYGDGVVASKNRDGSTTYFNIVYPSNAPYYLSYRLSNKRRIDYITDFGEEKLVYKTFGNNAICTGGAFDKHTSIIFKKSDVDTVLVASDGILSFDKNLDTVLDDFTKFNRPNGAYLRRRVGKAIKTYEKEGVYHYDDLAIGSFCSRE